MSINFPHSTRVLRNDGLVPAVVSMTIAGLALALWGAWFTLARVPVTVSCVPGETTRAGELLVRCPADAVGQLKQGAPAVAIVAQGGQRQTIDAVVIRVPDAYERNLAPDTIVLFAFGGATPSALAAAEVRVVVEERTPLEMVLKPRTWAGATVASEPAP